MELNLVIYGEPIAKQSFRRSNNGHCHQTTKIIKKEKDIAIQAKKQLPKGFVPTKKPVEIKRVWFIFEPLKTLSKDQLLCVAKNILFPKNTKPDIDNLEKLLYDALQGIVYENDSLIYKKSNIIRLYGKNPRIEIDIEVQDV